MHRLGSSSTPLSSLALVLASEVLLSESAHAVSGYVTGNVPISLIAGAGAFVGMTILGVPYALALALLLAIFDLILIFGATLGAIPPILAAFRVSPVKALILLINIIVSADRK